MTTNQRELAEEIVEVAQNKGRAALKCKLMKGLMEICPEHFSPEETLTLIELERELQTYLDQLNVLFALAPVNERLSTLAEYAESYGEATEKVDYLSRLSEEVLTPDLCKVLEVERDRQLTRKFHIITFLESID
jgi:hypothetical protein